MSGSGAEWILGFGIAVPTSCHRFWKRTPGRSYFTRARSLERYLRVEGVVECAAIGEQFHMRARTPQERAEVLMRVRKLAEVPAVPAGALAQAYEMLKEIEAELRAAEDDPELYNALKVVREKVMEAMEARAQELGMSEDWSHVKKGHDAMLMLRPLFRILDLEGAPNPEDTQKYIDAYRALSPDQRDALHYHESIAGIHLPRPEVLEGELRWNDMRLGSILRFIPDLRFGSWPQRFAAVFVGLLLVAGLALAIAKGSTMAAVVCSVLLSVAVATWTRDFLGPMRLKN